LKRVEHDERTDAMSLLHDGFHIINESTAENYVRDGNEQGVLIDGIKQALGRNGNTVIGFDHVHAGAAHLLCLPEIHDGGEIHVGVDDLVALS
jgi:hypothetical protein